MEATFACLPPPPCSAGGGSEDCISRLPDALLSNVVSRLPTKDAARTVSLSPRWRGIWASTPLVLDESDLIADLPDHGRDGDSTDWCVITDAVSRVLAAHPGPFRCVCLTRCCSYAAVHNGGALVRSWLRALAEKGVEDLVLFNDPSGSNLDLPADVLHIASLRRLCLGVWVFPRSHDLHRDTDVFPLLNELKLVSTDIGNAGLDRLLRYSPKLEKLALVASDNTPSTLWIRSRSLRCLLFWKSVADELNVIVAPDLERLILWSECQGARLGDHFRMRIGITNVPRLQVVGYLDPATHVIQIGYNTVQATTAEPRRAPCIPSVQILAVKVRFGVSKEVKMLESYLRCFPNVETLHVMCRDADKLTGKSSFKFWKEARPIRCVRSRIKRVMLRNFRGSWSELAFIKFLWERAQRLEKMVFILADGDDPASMEEVLTKLKSLSCVKQAMANRKSNILVRNGGGVWSVVVASDLSVDDPFGSCL